MDINLKAPIPAETGKNRRDFNQCTEGRNRIKDMIFLSIINVIHSHCRNCSPPIGRFSWITWLIHFSIMALQYVSPSVKRQSLLPVILTAQLGLTAWKAAIRIPRAIPTTSSSPSATIRSLSLDNGCPKLRSFNFCSALECCGMGRVPIISYRLSTGVFMTQRLQIPPTTSVP